MRISTATRSSSASARHSENGTTRSGASLLTRGGAGTALTEAGIAAAIVREGDEVRRTDTALAVRVRRAADALGAVRAEDERRIEIGLRADRAREVRVRASRARRC